jgi:hypothetical protein
MTAKKRFQGVGEIGVSNLMRPEKRTMICPFGFLIAFFLWRAHRSTRAYFLTQLPMKKARFFAVIAEKMRDYPMRSQELEDAPIFVMKLFNAF